MSVSSPALPGEKLDECPRLPQQGTEGQSRSCLAQPVMLQGQEEKTKWCKHPCRGNQIPVPAVGAGEWVLEQDQEPGWLAGRRSSQHPRQSAGTWHWLSWGGYFIFFFPLQDS